MRSKLSVVKNGHYQHCFICLLHARDALALWETDEIEMEALSNDAIILLMELLLD